MSDVVEKSDREIDREIAQKLFALAVKPITVIGRDVYKDIGTVGEPYVMSDGREGVEAKMIPRYSTDMSSAMLVIERLEARGYQWSFHRTNPILSMHENRPHAQFWTYREGVLQGLHCATAESLPRAICLAALAAINDDEK